MLTSGPGHLHSNNILGVSESRSSQQSDVSWKLNIRDFRDYHLKSTTWKHHALETFLRVWKFNIGDSSAPLPQTTGVGHVLCLIKASKKDPAADPRGPTVTGTGEDDFAAKRGWGQNIISHEIIRTLSMQLTKMNPCRLWLQGLPPLGSLAQAQVFYRGAG